MKSQDPPEVSEPPMKSKDPPRAMDEIRSVGLEPRAAPVKCCCHTLEVEASFNFMALTCELRCFTFAYNFAGLCYTTKRDQPFKHMVFTPRTSAVYMFVPSGSLNVISHNSGAMTNHLFVNDYGPRVQGAHATHFHVSQPVSQSR